MDWHPGDYMYDDEVWENPEPEEDWVQVGKKKGKKAKNGVNPQRPSLQKEIIDATGQESWWSEPASSNQVDEIDSLPLHPGRQSKQSNFDDYIRKTAKAPQKNGASSNDTPPVARNNGIIHQAPPLPSSQLGRAPSSPHFHQRGPSTEGKVPQPTAERRGGAPQLYPPQPEPIPGLVPNPNYQHVHQQQHRANAGVRPRMSYPPPSLPTSQRVGGNVVPSPSYPPSAGVRPQMSYPPPPTSQRVGGNVVPSPSYPPPQIPRSTPNAVPPTSVGGSAVPPNAQSRPTQSQPRRPDPPPPRPIPENLRPWLEAYKFKLACSQCFTKKPDRFGARAFTFYQWPAHRCTNDFILCLPREVSNSTRPWVLIRPRTNPNHAGAYRMCAQFQEETSCRVNHMSCHFAHSEEEMEVWDAERNGEFDRDELRSYLLGAKQPQRRNLIGSANQTTRQTPVSSNQVPRQTHANSNHTTSQTLPSSRWAPPQMPTGSYQTPRQNPAGSNQNLSQQRLATSSQVPPQPQPLRVPNQGPPYQGQGYPSMPPQQTRPAAPSQATAHQPPITPVQGLPSQGHAPHQRPAGQDHVPPRYQRSAHERFPAFPHHLKAVCMECFEGKCHTPVANSHNSCSSPGTHLWRTVVYLACSAASGHWVRVSSRPGELRPNIRAVMCNKATSCTYQLMTGLPCKYPHSAEEIDLWNYQADHGLKTIEEVIEIGQQARAESNTLSLSSFMPAALTQQSGKKHRWKYRDPPFVRSGNFKRCWHDLNNRCKYSQATNNFCAFAHSDGELEEWKHRHQLMKEQRQQQATPVRVTADMMQKNQGPFHTSEGPWITGHSGPSPPASQVREGYPGLTPAAGSPAATPRRPSQDSGQAGRRPMVISPQVKLTQADADELKVVMPMQVNPLNARYTHQWRFKVNPSDVPGLNQVCFLNWSHMQHFQMTWNKSASGILVTVTFLSTVPGFFQQPLFIDFRPDQSFRIFLTVFIGHEPLLDDEESSNQGEEQDLDRFPWNSANSDIVLYSPDRTKDPLYERLLRDYPPPPKEDIVFEQGEGVFDDSFRVYFHKLIQLEEKGCNAKISRYFGLHEMTLTNDIRELGAYNSAPTGQLFGKIEVGKQLMDNSDSSQIVSKMVNYVLLKFQATSKVVYQAVICKEGALYQSDEVIYVKIGERCVGKEKLQAGSKLTVQLQFQINRVTFCLLHYGVDHFKVLDIAFPEKEVGPRFQGVRKTELEDMNPRQESAARYIVGAGKDHIFHPGPTLIIGPYGTGKTHTIAKIVIRLLQSPDQDSKILIATHTNSAADWYITEHLHPFLRVHLRNNRSSLTRVHAHDFVDPKRVNQVIIENYALVEGDMQTGTRLRKPTLADILRCRVIVTTLTTSIHLVELAELHGKFTHIFIDEAGQALEPETMIPLGLAGPRTVVVLAGDHKQMGPKVHTKECRDRLFHRSMLERLNTASRILKYRNTCLLSFNYRLRPEILNFITKFYDGDPLTPMGKHLRHPDYYPVTFMEVKGLDQKRGSSYVNAIEAQSLVSAIQKLVADWPSQKWGQFDAKSICVLAPYTLQVKHIRTLLRAKQLGGVTVERVQNVQGKQFRVVFISTVRTRNTLKPGEDEDKAEEFYYGFLSDEGEIIAACTRAQSLLYVVGDPVALCSVGECQGVWRCYLQECEDNSSLLPEGTTVAGIKGEIEGLCEPMDEGVPPVGEVRQLNAGY